MPKFRLKSIILTFVICLFVYHRPALAENSLYPSRQITEGAKAFVTNQDRGFWTKTGVDQFETIYSGDPRQVGEIILNLAISNWASSDLQTTESLKTWIAQAIQKKDWGNNHDLEISHLLFSLAIAYDWYGANFDENLKKPLREFILNHTKELYDYGVTQNGYWGTSYWHNHCWINFSAILAVAQAFPEDPAAETWKKTATEALIKSLKLQSPDGANQEGLNYSVYGTLWLLRGMSLLQSANPDVFKDSEYLKHYPEFFLAWAVNEKLDTFFDVGDSPRYLWYNPAEIFLKLYQEYQDPRDLALFHYYAEVYQELPSGLFPVIYGIPNEKARMNAPWDFSKPQWFKDHGIFTYKSLTGDAVDCSFFFKSGIPGSRSAYEQMTGDSSIKLNISHTHPDQNSFVIWTKQGFLMADTGNAIVKKTEDHNTMIITAYGQLGEGDRWLKEEPYLKKKFGPNAGLQEFKSDTGYFMLTAEGKDFYPEELELEMFHRDMVYLEKIGFLIVDRIKFGRPQPFQLLFHSEFSWQEKSSGLFELMQGSHRAGSFHVLYPGAFSAQVTDKLPDVKANKRKTTPLHVLHLSPQNAETESLFVNFIGLPGYADRPEVIFQDNQMGILIKQKSKDCQVDFAVAGDLHISMKCTEYVKTKVENKESVKKAKAA